MDLGANSDTQWYCPPAVGALESIQSTTSRYIHQLPARTHPKAATSKSKGKEKEKKKRNHQHRSNLRQRRNHAQRPHNDPRRHPNEPRRTPINEPILRRQQDALPRRLQHHDETDNGDEAEVPPQFLPFAHAVHVVAIVPGAAFLLLDFIIVVIIIAGISSRVEGRAGFDDLDDLRGWFLLADFMGGGGGGEIHDIYLFFGARVQGARKDMEERREKEKKRKGKGHRGTTTVCRYRYLYIHIPYNLDKVQSFLPRPLHQSTKSIYLTHPPASAVYPPNLLLSSQRIIGQSRWLILPPLDPLQIAAGEGFALGMYTLSL